MTVGSLAATNGNTIANNAGDGVTMLGGTPAASDNPVLGNSIFDNGGLGIDLRPDAITGGVTENGACLATGANDCQPFPNVTAAAGGSAAVAGNLHADPSTTYRIELFVNTAADPSGNGEGERLLGSLQVTTNAGGAVAWRFADAHAALADGEFVTATATRLAQGEPRGRRRSSPTPSPPPTAR